MNNKIKEKAAEHIEKYRKIGPTEFSPVIELSSDQMRELHSSADWNVMEKKFFDMTEDNFGAKVHENLSYVSDTEIVIVSAEYENILLILIPDGK
jgi:hypothetical protein